MTLQELTSDAVGVAVSTIILHESGQWVQFEPLFLPANKLDAQGFGSAASYARRYALKAVWNLADEDDDGNKAVDGMKTQKAAQDAGYALASELLEVACDKLTVDEFLLESLGRAQKRHRRA